MYLEPGLCLYKLLKVAESSVPQTTCVIWIGCETVVWAGTGQCTKGLQLETEGSDVDTQVLTTDDTSCPTYAGVCPWAR